MLLCLSHLLLLLFVSILVRYILHTYVLTDFMVSITGDFRPIRNKINRLKDFIEFFLCIMIALKLEPITSYIPTKRF